MTSTQLLAELSQERNKLINHSLYQNIKTIEDLHAFMEHHVYAVWDFMSLLKALQNKLTCTTTPWVPTLNTQTRYLINEIVLAEESDVDQNGQRLSHFEMYIQAMNNAGADSTKISLFLDSLKNHQDVFQAIDSLDVHQGIKSFLNFTFTLIKHGQDHKIAAAFTLGREDLIPDMFSQIVGNIQKNFPEHNLSGLLYYFDRHIELDGDQHGPMAMEMIRELCQDDAQKWQEVLQTSKQALEHRLELWNAIQEQLELRNKA